MKKWMILVGLLMISILSACTNTPPENEDNPPNPPSTENHLEFENWLESKLETLTLEEKVGQMMQPERSGITLEEIKDYNIGSILNAGGSHPSDDPFSPLEDWYTMIFDMQEAALSSSSEIPLLYGIDAVHGNNNVYGATIFPHNINLGMIQDLETIEAVSRATALEMTALNMHLNYSPAVSIARDIRWGRTYESMGQTSEIVSERMQAYLRGAKDLIIPTVKHYVGDGATNFGIDQGDSTITEAEIRNVHLVPYVDAIEMGVPFIMVSYHSINGEKLHGYDYYLNNILKEELGFEGVLLSDYNAINQLPGDFKTQLINAINAGIDMLMQPFNWKDAYYLILEAVEEGLILEERIDDAVSRILKVKYDYDLFERPNHPFSPNVLNQTSHQEIAYQAAYESMVLLKDELNTPISELGKIYLTGPASNHVGLLSGGWTTEWQGNENADIGVGMSIKSALEEKVSLETSYEDADTVIVVLSETSYAEWFGDTMTPSLITGLSHPENQAALNLAMQAKQDGKNVIGLLTSGRPLILGNYLNTFDQFVALFLPGSEGGRAIASLLNHEVPFTAKLSYYWPSSSNHLSFNTIQDTHLFQVGYGLETEITD